MSTSSSPTITARNTRNKLLSRLGADDWERIAPYLEDVPIELRQVMHDIDQPIEHVYFVEAGVISVLSAMLDGTAVEVGTVGHEGMVGLSVVLGTDSAPFQTFGQIQGKAKRLSTTVLRQAIAGSDSLRVMLGRYTQAFLSQCMQGSACNRLHTIRQRCARWLLETHDRVESDSFTLTHEFLAQMLGVRRATVTEVAGQLQREGLIEYEYRRITVRDRRRLEEAACECYAIVHREFRRLVDGQEEPSLFVGQRTTVGGETNLHDPDGQTERTAGGTF